MFVFLVTSTLYANVISMCRHYGMRLINDRFFNVLRQIAAGQEYTVLSTIDDPASLSEIEVIMKESSISS